MINHRTMVTAAAEITALITGPTLVGQSRPAGAGTSPSPDIASRPNPVVVADTDVKLPLTRGTCPEIDLAPVQVLTPGPCGRIQLLASRRAGGGRDGGINIADKSPSPR